MYLVLKMFLFLLENENFKIIHFIGKKNYFIALLVKLDVGLPAKGPVCKTQCMLETSNYSFFFFHQGWIIGQFY